MLNIKILSSIERTGGAYNEQNISQNPTFPLDAILITITNRKSSKQLKKRKNVYRRIDSVREIKVPCETYLSDKDDIIHLLKQYSLRNMTLFYNAVCKDFDIDCSGIVDCYHAAYMYQRFKYPEVLDLC